MEIKMKLGQQLKIKQNQSLIMTPQLQQAIKLLQLTNLELAEFVEKAQLENPFIQDQKEYLEINNTNKGTESPDVYQNMNNISDPLKKNSELDMQNTFDSHLSSNNNQENKKLYDKEILRTGNNVSAGEVIEKTLENKISLKESLVNQINIEFSEKDNKSIAIAMIDYLHPSGWFTHSKSEIEKDLNINEQKTVGIQQFNYNERQIQPTTCHNKHDVLISDDNDNNNEKEMKIEKTQVMNEEKIQKIK